MVFEDLVMYSINQLGYGLSAAGPHFMPKRLVQMFCIAAAVRCHPATPSLRCSCVGLMFAQPGLSLSSDP